MATTNTNQSLQIAIADSYSSLSITLQQAADFIVQNGFAVATRSLRSIAAESEISPASYTRLARALGFTGYEQLREKAKEELASSSSPITAKAKALRDKSETPFLPRQVDACLANIQALTHDVQEQQLEAAVETLAGAKKVIIVGALGSAGFADYFAYLTSWFDGRWSVAGRNGITLASSLSRLTRDDAIIVISKSPYATRAVGATEMAASRGARVVVLTDSHAFPGLCNADHVFIQQTDSPQFFASYAATLVLIETLTGMLLARSGKDTIKDIESIVEQNRQLGEIRVV